MRAVNFFRSFLQLSVPAERKWTDIFRHCDEWLAGGSGEGSATRGGGGGAAVVERGTAADRSARAWSVVAIAIANGKKSIRENRLDERHINIVTLAFKPARTQTCRTSTFDIFFQISVQESGSS